LAFQGDLQGVGIGLIEISQQMLTKVNSAGMCVAKHSFTCCQAANKTSKPCFASLTKSYICVKFLLSLDFLLLFDHAKSKEIVKDFMNAYTSTNKFNEL